MEAMYKTSLKTGTGIQSKGSLGELRKYKFFLCLLVVWSEVIFFNELVQDHFLFAEGSFLSGELIKTTRQSG